MKEFGKWLHDLTEELRDKDDGVKNACREACMENVSSISVGNVTKIITNIPYEVYAGEEYPKENLFIIIEGLDWARKNILMLKGLTPTSVENGSIGGLSSIALHGKDHKIYVRHEKGKIWGVDFKYCFSAGHWAQQAPQFSTRQKSLKSG